MRGKWRAWSAGENKKDRDVGERVPALARKTGGRREGVPVGDRLRKEVWMDRNCQNRGKN